MREKFRNFMIGRYGPDQLYVALFAAAMAAGLLGSLTRLGFFMMLSYFILLIAVYRFFSKNILRRRAENDVFLRYLGPAKYRLRRTSERLKSSRTHKFFKCPNCKNTLRVPRGKGRIQITCPKCGERFEKNT